MYSREDNGPASAPWFLDRSSLRFSESAPCSDKTVWPGPWSPGNVSELGLLAPRQGRWRYETKEGLLCRQGVRSFLPTDHTRPYNSGRPSGLNRDEGFFLEADLDRGGTTGMPSIKVAGNREFQTAAPVYYDDGVLLRAGSSIKSPKWAYISYWFFYPYNDAPSVRLFWDHQGDWENMSLLFRKDSGSRSSWVLEAVSYAAHGAPEAVDATCSTAVYARNPSSCPVPRTQWGGEPRLVGFVADGDHATYPAPGTHRLRSSGNVIADHTSTIESGFSWPTWQNLLALESQGWAGFCGAWGKVGSPHFLFATDRTGPLGPGCLDEQERQRKSGRPQGWGASKSSPEDRSAAPGQAVGIDPVVDASDS